MIDSLFPNPVLFFLVFPVVLFLGFTLGGGECNVHLHVSNLLNPSPEFSVNLGLLLNP